MTEELKTKELMFQENKQRFSIFPLQYPEIWKVREKQVANHWVRAEIDFSEDKAQWPTLPKNEQDYIKRILSFFSTADAVLLENMENSLLMDIQIPEAQSMLRQMEGIEDIHNECYNFMTETIITDEVEKREIYDGIYNCEAVRGKADWATKYFTSKNPAEVFVAQAVLEQLFISVSFVPFFYMKKKGILPGFSTINTLASRDENLHGQFACIMYSMLETKLSPEHMVDMIVKAVELEDMFTDYALIDGDLLGMTKSSMYIYTRFVANRLLVDMGYKAHWSTEEAHNPFPFMDAVSMEGKTNFFERRGAEYQRATGDTSIHFDMGSMDEDF
jgi:ribonucleoside-diphosphate reductase beta chain